MSPPHTGDGKRRTSYTDRNYEVGKALADAGARFRYQMTLGGDGPRDGIGHFELLRAMLVIRQPRRDAALWARDVGGS